MKLAVGSLVAVGIGASAWWLSSKPNRIKAQSSLRDLKRKIKPTAIQLSKILPIQKSGNPHPHDLEDNKMVDEGSQYGIQYFNENMQ